MQTILVTGANTGIGLALCKQLTKDHGVKVILGSRSVDKGTAAVQQVKDYAAGNGDVELLQIDVGNDESVQKAAAALKEKGITLNALVNNAGTGLGHGVTTDTIMNVNLMGVKRVVDAFLPFLGDNSKIINVGSGSGPMYVTLQPLDRQKKLCNPDITWDEIQVEYNRGVPPEDPAHGQATTDHYGLSKALLMCYTMYLAKSLKEKNISVYNLTPGYIDTAITAGWPGGKPAEEGTVSIRHCLFETTPEQSGWFFGSDAKRSPLHVLRNPGEPVYDGVIDWAAVEKNIAEKKD